MIEFRRVLLNMYSSNTHIGFFASGVCETQTSLHSKWSIALGYLIILWKICVKIVLSIKGRAVLNFTPKRVGTTKSLGHDIRIESGQDAWLPLTNVATRAVRICWIIDNRTLTEEL